MKKPIDELINQCIEHFQSQEYSIGTINEYKRSWRNGIVPYMRQNGIKDYGCNVGERYCIECCNDPLLGSDWTRKARSIEALNEMLSQGCIKRHRFKKVEHRLDGVIGHEMAMYLDYLKGLRRNDKTLTLYQRYLSEFLFSLTNHGVMSLSEIRERHIISMVAARTCQHKIVSVLRGIFRYWVHGNKVDATFIQFFDAYKPHKKERIPSFYSEKEISRIEESIQRSSAIGKRNYAMFMLASRLGLRASDIANLKLENINWERSLICLSMEKTKKYIELPLLTDVGNAIIDYLRYGRPKTRLRSVFLNGRAPYNAVEPTCVSDAVGYIIRKSGVDIGNRHHGPHALRHSLASEILKNGHAFPVISEVLGHQSTMSTMKYINIDIVKLKKCALEVPAIPKDFYEQEGGVFYE